MSDDKISDLCVSLAAACALWVVARLVGWNGEESVESKLTFFVGGLLHSCSVILVYALFLKPGSRSLHLSLLKGGEVTPFHAPAPSKATPWGICDGRDPILIVQVSNVACWLVLRSFRGFPEPRHVVCCRAVSQTFS